MCHERGREGRFACVLRRVQLFVTLRTSPPGSYVRGYPRQEYWSGLPFPPPGDLAEPGIERMSPASSALAGKFCTTETPRKPP